MNMTTTIFRSCLVALALLSTGLAYTSPTSGTGASRSQPIDVEQEMANFEEAEEGLPMSEASMGDDAEEGSPNERYRIELLVFAYVNTGEENSEIWRNPPRPDFSTQLNEPSSQPEETASSDQLQQTGQQEEPTQPERHFLDPDEENVSQFMDILRKMAINGQYRTLKHLVWEQVVLPPEANDLFYLQGGDNYPSYQQLLTLIQQQEQETVDSEPTREQSDNKQANLSSQPGMPELEGTLHIYRSRYLHIVPDLWFSEFALNDAGQCIFDETRPNALLSIEPLTYLPTPENGSSNTLTLAQYSYTPLTNFSISQRRRLKNGEIHYLDHPRFGFLIVFNKIVEEKKETDESSTDTPNNSSEP